MPKVPVLGGLVVARPAPIVCAPRSSQGLCLMSDLHGGSSQIDESLILRELKAAKRAGDRVLLGGDIFDLILPSDRRRYVPSKVHASLRGRDDLVNAAVERVFGWLEPYADLIDAVGLGNHETAAIQHASVDAVRLLVDRLNAARTDLTPEVIQMGYTALLNYRLLNDAGRQVGRYVVYYHHGSGKIASAYGSLKGLLTKAASFQADLYWSGHSHARAACAEVAYRLERGRLVARDVRCVVTGSYMNPYGEQSAGSSSRRGPKGNYASEAGFSPHGMGGARVVLRWDRPGRPDRVEVIQ